MNKRQYRIRGSLQPAKSKLLMFHYHPLAFSLLFFIGPSSAEDYFDPAFLRVLGAEDSVDLSTFAKSGSISEGEYPVAVFINQRSFGQVILNFTKNNKGNITPELTPNLLDKLGVNVKNIPELKDLPQDELINDLPALIPQAMVKLDFSILRLDISIPQVAMKPNLDEGTDPSLWQEGIPAFITNYNFSYGRTTSHYNQQRSHNNNLFASFRMGANAGPWRLRSTATHTRFNSDGNENYSGSNESRTRFSNTNLSRDLIGLRSTLLVGESNSDGEIFDGVPFKGLKLSSNEQMLPSQLRGFAPPVTGIANSNARVTIRQNGNIIYETYVAPGPFYINDIQQAGLSGDFDVSVTEANGTIRQFIVPYSSLPMMLRPGSWKYEIVAGRYDGNITKQSRDSEFTQITGVYGLPQNITLYGGGMLSKDYQAFSGGTGISLGVLGALSADVTQSIAKFSQGDNKTGQSYRLRYSKSMLSTGTTVDMTALRYSTKDYFSFNEFNSEGYSLEEGVSPWTLQRKRNSFQTQISQEIANFGTLNLHASRDDYWGTDRTLTGLSAGYSNNIKGISYGINYNIDRIKDSQGNWPENRQFSINFSMPFSLFGHQSNLQSMYATASMTHDNNGRVQNQAGLSGSLLSGNTSYSLSQSWGNQQQAANSSANLSYRGSKGTVSTGYSYSNESRSMNMNASGGFLLHGDGITFAQNMGDAIALVNAPGAEGVVVTNGSAVVDKQGYAVVPYLSSYNKNSIGLDPTTLPDDVDLTQSNINVYPIKGAVVKANFKTRIGYQVLINLKLPNGVVPFGAIATLIDPELDDPLSSIVGDGGQVYLAGLPEQGVLRVKWGNELQQQCQTRFDLRGLAISPEMMMRQLTVNCVIAEK